MCPSFTGGTHLFSFSTFSLISSSFASFSSFSFSRSLSRPLSRSPRSSRSLSRLRLRGRLLSLSRSQSWCLSRSRSQCFSRSRSRSRSLSPSRCLLSRGDLALRGDLERLRRLGDFAGECRRPETASSALPWRSPTSMAISRENFLLYVQDY